MPSVLLTVFLIQLVIHIISTLGSAYLTELLWALYNALTFPPTSTSAAAFRRQQRDVLRLKAELASTSAQDDFAKWAKLRRAHDKASAEHDATAAALAARKSRFSGAAKALRWVGTAGTRFVVQMWFQRVPVFWIPKGWVPGAVEWVLCFPRAPRGSVSVQVWWIACASVVVLVESGVRGCWVLVRGETEEVGEKGKARPFMEKGEGEGEKTEGKRKEVKLEEKKEL